MIVRERAAPSRGPLAAAPTVRPSVRMPPEDALAWLLRVTGLVAAAELLILRLFTRTAIHIPGVTRLEVVFVPIAEIGRFAFYLASVLLLVCLLLMARELVRRRSASSSLAGSGIVLFLVVGVLARLGSIPEADLDWAVVCAIVLLMPWAVGGLPRGARLPVILFAGAFVLAAIFGMDQMAGGGGRWADASWPAVGGEVLALAAALSMPLLAGGAGGRRALTWGLGAAAMTSGALLANASTTRILLLWSFGLAGYLPGVAYGAAVGAVVYAIVALRRRGNGTLAWGVAFLFMGGIGLHSTYQSALVLVGLAVLGMAAPWTRHEAVIDR